MREDSIQRAEVDAQRFFHATLDSLTLHLAVLDESGTILLVNQAWRRFAANNDFVDCSYGLGQNYLAVCDGADHEEAVAAARGIRAVLSGEQYSYIQPYPCDSPDEQRWFQMRATRFTGLGPARVVVTHEDITEQRETQAALRVSEKWLRQAADAARFGYYDYNFETHSSTWSPEIYAIHGLSPDETIDFERISQLIHPDDRDRFREFVAHSLQSPADYKYSSEFRIVRPNGEVRWLADRGQIIFADQGPDRRPVRATGMIVDVTDRKRYERELLDADRHKDEFITVLAHELRNPLAPIRNASQFFELANPSDQGLAEMAGIVKRQVDHMARMLDDLLNISRVRHGKIQLKRQPVDLTELVNTTVEDLRATFEESGLALTTRWPGLALTADADPLRLAQCIGNLLSNARKFTDSGGRVSIELGREHQTALITIRDTGIGMEADFIARLFEPFRQAERSLHRSADGLGVGLALVKCLVELHGGQVAAASDGPGTGSTFIIRLPLITP